MPGDRGLYSVIWIPILDPDYRYLPTKSISPVGKGREHALRLSVFMARLFMIQLVC